MTSLSSAQTALAGLAEVALADAAFTPVIDSIGAAALDIVAPKPARPFIAAALAARTPVLLVTATGREADDLTSELTEMLGGGVAQFPSWETLPHERLSPSADTVGRRVEVLRRLARPDDASYGSPLRVIVTTVRSLVQPMAPGLGEIEPITLRVGTEIDFDSVLVRLVEMAYSRVDMVGKRGEFAVRGGILDLFSPTADHPVRIEFWGDEVSELRYFSVADQRSLPDVDVDSVIAPPCRELILTADVRDRAAALAAENQADASLVEMLDKISAGIPVEGMEALLPVLKPGELQLLSDVLPVGAHILLCDPEKVRTRATDLVRTARNSWKRRGPRRRSAALHRWTRRSSTAGESISAPPHIGRSGMFANLPKLPAVRGGRSVRWRPGMVKNSNSRFRQHRRFVVPTTCWPNCSSACGHT